MYIVSGPSQSKESRVDVVAIASEPNWTLNAHSTVDNSQNYRFRLSLAWRSSSNSDRRCPPHLSHQCRSNVRGRSLYSISDSHVACPHRGRKRLSREATLRILLALEWPELVQIGRCKVRWLPTDANKRNLTSSYSEKIIYTTLPPPGGSFDPETKSQHGSIFDGVVACDHLLEFFREVEVASRRPRSVIN